MYEAKWPFVSKWFVNGTHSLIWLLRAFPARVELIFKFLAAFRASPHGLSTFDNTSRRNGKVILGCFQCAGLRCGGLTFRVLGVRSFRYDALVIGCGPGGSSAATFLGRPANGCSCSKRSLAALPYRRVLLPCNQAIFGELGVLPALQAPASRAKPAPSSYSATARSAPASFSAWADSSAPQAVQVERANVDLLLKANTRGSAPTSARAGRSNPLRTPGVANRAIRRGDRASAPFSSLTPADAEFDRQPGGFQDRAPRLKKLAVFGHFTGVWPG